MKCVQNTGWLLVVAGCLGLLLAGCSDSRAPLTIAINAPTGPLTVNSDRQFTATVAGAYHHKVTWSVDEGVSGGSFSPTTPGLYTAPATPGTYTITATSVVSPSAKASVQVIVVAADGPTIQLNATTATIDPGQARVFVATLSGVDDPEVTWSTVPATGAGTLVVLDAVRVVYTAPATPGTYQLIAASVENPALQASVTITVPASAIPTELIVDNGNTGGVSNGPTNPTVFTIATARHIVSVENYHYFNGGALPGTIALQHEDGTIYGPWQTTGLPGQGSVSNAYWICYPEIEIKAGTYTVIDSDPGTWSHNALSGYCGFTRIYVRSQY